MSRDFVSDNTQTQVAWKRSRQEARVEPTRHGALKRVLIRHEDVHSPLMFLNEVYVAPGEQVERHQHEDMEEVFYFLEGEGTMQLAEEVQTVSAGDRVVVPMKVPHILENTGTQELRCVCFGVKALPDKLWEGWQPE